MRHVESHALVHGVEAVENIVMDTDHMVRHPVLGRLEGSARLRLVGLGGVTPRIEFHEGLVCLQVRGLDRLELIWQMIGQLALNLVAVRVGHVLS